MVNELFNLWFEGLNGLRGSTGFLKFVVWLGDVSMYRIFSSFCRLEERLTGKNQVPTVQLGLALLSDEKAVRSLLTNHLWAMGSVL